MDDEIVVGLDIGTSAVYAIAGKKNESGVIEVIGLGQAKSEGLRKGVVVNIEKTVQSISKAVEEAELMSGIEIYSVIAGLSGGHIKGINSRGTISVSNSMKEITEADVERVLESAQAIAIPPEREVIHVLPQEYIIDGAGGIKDPVGMSGVRLEVIVHIITAAVTSAQNIVRSIQKAGLEAGDIALEPLAASLSTLTEDEKELGVVLVDLGGGTTDIVVYINGAVWHTEVISLGGEYITKDISYGLRTPYSSAEDIKIKHGVAMQSLVSKDEMVDIPVVGGTKVTAVPRQFIAQIIESRLSEIFSLVSREIKKIAVEDVLSGVVLTGGGASIEGAVELAEKIIGIPARIGRPTGVEGLVEEIKNPKFAASIGLLRYGFEERDAGAAVNFSIAGDLFKKILRRMKLWKEEFF